MSALAQDIRRRITKDFGPTAVLAEPIGTTGTFSYTAPDQIMVEDSANDAEMYIDFVVVTDEDDREGDTIDPMGCMDYIGEYERNAAWLVEHDAKEQIAVCRAALGGPLTLRIEKSRIIARPYYNRLSLRGSRLSEEFYLLAKNGLFIGASPGFLPMEGRKRGYGKSDGYAYRKWRLTELSQTSQPVNQSALRMSLSRGIVKSLGLKHRLESLLIKPNPVVRGGFTGKAMSKPKTASIEFDKSIFPEEKVAIAWLDQHGYDSSACTPLPASFVFKQRDGKPNAGQKSLGKGVVALLTKAFGKDEKDDDEDKKKKDEKPNDMADEKVEKADDEKDSKDESEAADDEADVNPDDESEDDEVDDEGAEAEGEAGAEDETEYDPAALKKEADNLVDMIAHFEIACEHAERMKGESVKSPELFDKLHADATALVADLRAAYKYGFADQAMESAIEERKAGPTDKQDELADSTAGDDAAHDAEYKDVAKALTAALKGLDAAKKTAKSLPRLAVA
jgi:hypothetical protein